MKHWVCPRPLRCLLLYLCVPSCFSCSSWPNSVLSGRENNGFLSGGWAERISTLEKYRFLENAHIIWLNIYLDYCSLRSHSWMSFLAHLLLSYMCSCIHSCILDIWGSSAQASTWMGEGFIIAKGLVGVTSPEPEHQQGLKDAANEWQEKRGCGKWWDNKRRVVMERDLRQMDL